MKAGYFMRRESQKMRGGEVAEMRKALGERECAGGQNRGGIEGAPVSGSGFPHLSFLGHSAKIETCCVVARKVCD
jgi:hypothetical protein